MENRKLTVDFLAIAFGIGAWIAINGIWVELPILVQELPEQWNLPSYLSVIIQIANIGPISYGLAKVLRPSMPAVPIIYIVLLIGCTSSLLLCFLWDRTSFIGGKEHSIGLFTLVLFLALVDCTSSVLYIPYMAVWKEVYFPSYLIGEGLSGLLPGLFSLAQGVGGNAACGNVTINASVGGSVSWDMQQTETEPNYSVETFFFLIFAMMIASAGGYFLLQQLPYVQSERDPKERTRSQISVSSSTILVRENGSCTLPMERSIFLMLLATQAWSSMLSNGFLPSIQSYSCGPYGNMAYHLAVTLSSLVNPLAAFSTMFLPRARPHILLILSAIGSAFATYIITTSVMSPTPPLVDVPAGVITIIFVWVVFSATISYVRIEIANVLREVSARHLFWSGAVTQGGSAIGALSAFFLVNWTNIFVAYDPCK